MRKKVKLVCGVGINDANYQVTKSETAGYNENGKRIARLVWICPFYMKWINMLCRCYNKKYQEKQPTYVGCSVTPEWHYFMNFRSWMEKQDWEGKVLDKDILVPENKVYGPETCIFVSQTVNNFLAEGKSSGGKSSVGVCFDEKRKVYIAQCCDVYGKQKKLGSYSNAVDGHLAWLSFKREQAHILASQQSDPRVAEALINRYENWCVVADER